MGPTSEGKEGSGRDKESGGGDKGEREGRGLEPPPLQISGYATDRGQQKLNG